MNTRKQKVTRSRQGLIRLVSILFFLSKKAKTRDITSLLLTGCWISFVLLCISKKTLLCFSHQLESELTQSEKALEVNEKKVKELTDNLKKVRLFFYLFLLYAWQNYCILIGWEDYNYFINRTAVQLMIFPKQTKWRIVFFFLYYLEESWHIQLWTVIISYVFFDLWLSSRDAASCLRWGGDGRRNCVMFIINK